MLAPPRNASAAQALRPSQTIVRQIIGGDDPDTHRFVVLVETQIHRGFVFKRTSEPLTLRDVCDLLIAHSLSEEDAVELLNEAVRSFRHA